MQAFMGDVHHAWEQREGNPGMHVECARTLHEKERNLSASYKLFMPLGFCLDARAAQFAEFALTLRNATEVMTWHVVWDVRKPQHAPCIRVFVHVRETCRWDCFWVIKEETWMTHRKERDASNQVLGAYAPLVQELDKKGVALTVRQKSLSFIGSFARCFFCSHPFLSCSEQRLIQCLYQTGIRVRCHRKTSPLPYRVWWKSFDHRNHPATLLESVIFVRKLWLSLADSRFFPFLISTRLNKCHFHGDQSNFENPSVTNSVTITHIWSQFRFWRVWLLTHCGIN